MSEARGMTHDEAAELLGAYALNAVDPPERAAIEAHLEGCPRCRAEVNDHGWVAARLGNSGGDAPPGLWERISGALEETAPPMRLDLPAGDAQVIPLAARRRRAPRLVLAAAAVAAVVVIGVLGAQVDRQDDRIASLEQALEGEAMLRTVSLAFADPDADRTQLSSPDGTIVLAAALLDGSGFLMAEDLPALAADRTYQLWGQTSSGLVSLGLLGAVPNDVVTFQAAAEVSALAITEEAAGGVASSSNPPVLAGRFD